MKLCNKCHRDLPDSAFHKRKRRGREVLRPRCIECSREDSINEWRRDRQFAPEARAEARERSKAWRAIPGNKQRKQDWDFRTKYGITLADWQAKLTAQQGLCAVCEKPMDKINVDHDHATGTVRDLLCNRCNLGLGYFRDDPAGLIAAAAYLQRWGKR